MTGTEAAIGTGRELQKLIWGIVMDARGEGNGKGRDGSRFPPGVLGTCGDI